MSNYGRYDPHSPYAPSAPSLPENHPPYSTSSSSAAAPPPPSNYQYAPHTATPPPPPSTYNTYGTTATAAAATAYDHGSTYHGAGTAYGQAPSSAYPPPPSSSHGYSAFPPGTHPDVIRSFQMADTDRSGFIDEAELQRALSSGYQKFNIRTIRLLMFLFKDPTQPPRIGPKEFAEIWNCIAHWRGIFERYDKDRSGKIDPLELRDALYGIGYAIPGTVLQLLLAQYGDGNVKRVELGFDSFVECGVIIKGLTEKFKEKDKRYTGSAKLSYDEFMAMVIPFLVAYDD
ncbi:probable calcium-binding protein CML48 [Arachis stenosperma]|uniref:probable calcium-binding protein CML48 n=1 Tax=Arachis stenosperma TaxID=217475 RepID=UPI0025AD0D87|nr:probable calcium-binding protein CML48 [Arachis stenosperma]